MDQNQTAEPRFSQVSGAFALSCTIQISITAKPETIWRLLTDAGAFPRWNSTVTAIEGQIREGERLKIHAPGTARVFTPRVSGVVPDQRMVWSDGVPGIFRGVRTFTLARRDNTSTDFLMTERFSGLVFALTKRMLPDFRPIFLTYAVDLKREAERLTRPAQVASGGE
jgi:uncharacterized protein YndB with AHSA1/START domain